MVDPIAETETAIPLSYVPRCVSVSPDGNRAVVGHNAYLTYVDLVAGTVAGNPLMVSADVGDVVLTATYAYVFPRVDQWVEIHSIRLSDGRETLSGSWSIRAGTMARLQPGAAPAIYGADNGLSPSDIERYDISAGTAQYVRDSPYHGDYPMCGNLWFNTAGNRIITACGRIFRASSDVALDMRYAGAIEGFDTGYATASWVSHNATINRLAVIPRTPSYGSGYPDTELRLHDGTTFTAISTIVLPSFVLSFQGHAGHGRFVFHTQDGTRMFALVQADATSQLTNDWGVVAY